MQQTCISSGRLKTPLLWLAPYHISYQHAPDQSTFICFSSIFYCFKFFLILFRIFKPYYLQPSEHCSELSSGATKLCNVPYIFPLNIIMGGKMLHQPLQLEQQSDDVLPTLMYRMLQILYLSLQPIVQNHFKPHWDFIHDTNQTQLIFADCNWLCLLCVECFNF